MSNLFFAVIDKFFGSIAQANENAGNIIFLPVQTLHNRPESAAVKST